MREECPETPFQWFFTKETSCKRDQAVFFGEFRIGTHMHIFNKTPSHLGIYFWLYVPEGVCQLLVHVFPFLWVIVENFVAMFVDGELAIPALRPEMVDHAKIGHGIGVLPHLIVESVNETGEVRGPAIETRTLLIHRVIFQFHIVWALVPFRVVEAEHFHPTNQLLMKTRNSSDLLVADIKPCGEEAVDGVTNDRECIEALLVFSLPLGQLGLFVTEYSSWK